MGSNAGNFNTLNLTTTDGAALDFEVLSGNSGSDLSALAPGSIVTFNLYIPAGVSSYTFYAQTMQNGTEVNLGSIGYNIGINSATTKSGILIVQPTSFNLTPSYESQIIIYINTGNGAGPSAYLNSTGFFTNVQANSYWFSSLSAQTPTGAAWYVNFTFGLTARGTLAKFSQKAPLLFV